MKKIVRIKTFSGPCVVNDTKFYEVEDYNKCDIVRESLENGVVIETFYIETTNF